MLYEQTGFELPARLAAPTDLLNAVGDDGRSKLRITGAQHVAYTCNLPGAAQVQASAMLAVVGLHIHGSTGSSSISRVLGDDADLRALLYHGGLHIVVLVLVAVHCRHREENETLE